MNRLRWQLIADRNERPKPYAITRRFPFELVGTISPGRNDWQVIINLLFVSPELMLKMLLRTLNYACFSNDILVSLPLVTWLSLMIRVTRANSARMELALSSCVPVTNVIARRWLVPSAGDLLLKARQLTAINPWHVPCTFWNENALHHPRCLSSLSSLPRATEDRAIFPRLWVICKYLQNVCEHRARLCSCIFTRNIISATPVVTALNANNAGISITLDEFNQGVKRSPLKLSRGLLVAWGSTNNFRWGQTELSRRNESAVRAG